jgi:hypothetical protein
VSTGGFVTPAAKTAPVSASVSGSVSGSVPASASLFPGRILLFSPV